MYSIFSSTAKTDETEQAAIDVFFPVILPALVKQKYAKALRS